VSSLVVVDADVLGRQRTGDESYVSALLAELPWLAPELRFAAVTRRPDLVPGGVMPISLPARSQPFRMAYKLPRLLRSLPQALTHFQHVVPPGTKPPVVLTIHDLSFEYEPGLMGIRDRFYFRTMVPRSAHRAARILTVSEQTKRDLIEWYKLPEDKIVVTLNGVDEAFAPEGLRREGAPYLLFVGTLQPRKDPVTAIEALALTHTDLRLVLAGPDRGSKEAARATVARLGLESRVEFAGHVSKPDLAALYRGAACLVFPSRYEGFGLPVLEAMASGTPVVTTSAGALPEVTGDAAIIVEPGNPVELAAGIERALADRERLARGGIERAQRFTWTETARRTVEVYRELL
jgi:glycosyltransferase involved in cell wall biosynthesis